MSWKKALFRLLGKDPEPIVVSFLSGPEPLALQMLAEVRRLVPDREHWAITELDIPGITCVHPTELPFALMRKRIGLAPTLFSNDPEYRWLRWQALRLAPRKLLAYNTKLERHHLRLRTALASFLFWRGVPLDRIWLRPSWLFPWKRDRTKEIDRHTSFLGRPLTPGRPQVAVFTPYFPFPLSHGGAVRIYNLLREAARDFDLILFSFADKASTVEGSPLLDLCAEVVIFPQPRYREPRWATLDPPEVNEFRSPYVARILREYKSKLLQIEYTQLASYDGNVLVEHDVTFDLYDQIEGRQPSLSARWNAWRWRRFENKALSRFKRVVAMSQKDATLLDSPSVRIIPNGVDLARFRPEPEQSGSTLLFVGSFRHFPNITAFRWLIEEVWPLLDSRLPDIRLLVIAGPNPEQYWDAPITDDRIELHGFVSDVRPFYAASKLALVPTQESAGTNLKVLEAMAMERAVVSTTSGCAGLGLVPGESIWIADTPSEFAEAVVRLLANEEERKQIASHARVLAKAFDWRHLAWEQKKMWNELLSGVVVRGGTRNDLPSIERIQAASHSASQWEPGTYFDFEVFVAELDGNVAGFLVSRDVGGEIEVLNLAVAPESRRRGVAKGLLASLPPLDIFLEVRESNSLARQLYSSLGYSVVGTREAYYENPVESALVMRLAKQKPVH